MNIIQALIALVFISYAFGDKSGFVTKNKTIPINNKNGPKNATTKIGTLAGKSTRSKRHYHHAEIDRSYEEAPVKPFESKHYNERNHQYESAVYEKNQRYVEHGESSKYSRFGGAEKHQGFNPYADEESKHYPHHPQRPEKHHQYGQQQEWPQHPEKHHQYGQQNEKEWPTTDSWAIPKNQPKWQSLFGQKPTEWQPWQQQQSWNIQRPFWQNFEPHWLQQHPNLAQQNEWFQQLNWKPKPVIQQIPQTNWILEQQQSPLAFKLSSEQQGGKVNWNEKGEKNWGSDGTQQSHPQKQIDWLSHKTSEDKWVLLPKQQDQTQSINWISQADAQQPKVNWIQEPAKQEDQPEKQKPNWIPETIQVAQQTPITDNWQPKINVIAQPQQQSQNNEIQVVQPSPTIAPSIVTIENWHSIVPNTPSSVPVAQPQQDEALKAPVSPVNSKPVSQNIWARKRRDVNNKINSNNFSNKTQEETRPKRQTNFSNEIVIINSTTNAPITEETRHRRQADIENVDFNDNTTTTENTETPTIIEIIRRKRQTVTEYVFQNDTIYTTEETTTTDGSTTEETTTNGSTTTDGSATEETTTDGSTTEETQQKREATTVENNSEFGETINATDSTLQTTTPTAEQRKKRDNSEEWDKLQRADVVTVISSEFHEIINGTNVTSTFESNTNTSTDGQREKRDNSGEWDEAPIHPFERADAVAEIDSQLQEIINGTNVNSTFENTTNTSTVGQRKKRDNSGEWDEAPIHLFERADTATSEIDSQFHETINGTNVNSTLQTNTSTGGQRKKRHDSGEWNEAFQRADSPITIISSKFQETINGTNVTSTFESSTNTSTVGQQRKKREETEESETTTSELFSSTSEITDSPSENDEEEETSKEGKINPALNID